MSDGPIKRDREAFARRAPVSTNAKTSLHFWSGAGGGHAAYCGHRGGTLTSTLADVTCSACIAAWDADCADAYAAGTPAAERSQDDRRAAAHALRDLGREIEGDSDA